MARWSMPLASLVAVLGTGMSLSGCGPSPTTSSTESAEVYSFVHSMGAGATAWAPRSIEDLLPNTKYRVDGELHTLTDLVVVGRLVEVVAGRGFVAVEAAEPTSGVEVAFDDPDAWWKTVHARVEPLEVLGGDAPDELWLGISVAGKESFEAVRDDLLSMDEAVYFLYQGSQVVDYDADLYAILYDGETLTLVDADGHLSMPVLDRGLQSRMLESVSTLRQLRAAAREPAKLLPGMINPGGALLPQDLGCPVWQDARGCQDFAG